MSFECATLGCFACALKRRTGYWPNEFTAAPAETSKETRRHTGFISDFQRFQEEDIHELWDPAILGKINREFGKKISCPQAPLPKTQGAREHRNVQGAPTPPKPDTSGINTTISQTKNPSTQKTSAAASFLYSNS